MINNNNINIYSAYSCNPDQCAVQYKHASKNLKKDIQDSGGNNWVDNVSRGSLKDSPGNEVDVERNWTSQKCECYDGCGFTKLDTIRNERFRGQQKWGGTVNERKSGKGD